MIVTIVRYQIAAKRIYGGLGAAVVAFGLLFTPVDLALAAADPPLVVAAREGNTALAKKSIRRGAAVNATGQYGRTPLQVASENDHADIVALLIAAGADVNVHNVDKAPALVTAASKGHLEISRLLLDAGADTAVTVGKDQQTIGVLADWTNSELAKLLKSHGIDINATNAKGETVAHRQTQSLLGKLNWLEAKSITDPDYDGEAYWQDSLRTYRAYFDAGADPNIQDGNGRTPLVLLAPYGLVGATQVLLDAGADPNLRDRDGKSAFDIASKLGKGELVALLADRGSNPNADPLVLFEALRHADAAARLQLLLDAGADPNAVAKVCITQSGRTRQACDEGDFGKVERRHILPYAISEMHWSLGQETDKRRNEKNLEVLRVLLEAGADPNYGAPSNSLWHALRVANPGLARLLLEYGAELEGIGPQVGRGSKIVFLPHEPYRLRSSYRQAYADIERQNKREIVSAFLEFGADPNEVHPETGMTPLRLAVRRGEIGIVRVLISIGAEVRGDYVADTTILEAAIMGRRRNLVRSVCSVPSQDCENTKQFVKDRRTIIKELVLAGAEPTQDVSEEVQRLVVRGSAFAKASGTSTDYSEVVREFDKAQKLAPAWPEIYYKLAAVHEASEDYPAAVEHYEIYLALAPNAANWREIQDHVYELEVYAENHVTTEDIYRIFFQLGNGPWQLDGSAAFVGGKFKTGDNGMTFNTTHAVTNRPMQFPVEVIGRSVSWRSVFHMCGGSPEYGNCPMRMNNMCEVQSKTRVDCRVEYYNDWPKDNSGTGSNGGERSSEQYSWLRRR